jgi:phenylpropionate dioxygenase-like ring-hydroxylating dioxygenase large terminal subunit
MNYLNTETLIGENFGMSIKICCVYFEGKYTPDYVEKLYNGLKRHCTLPFEFICYSDNPNVKADVVIPLPKYSDIKYHWHKLTFFSPLFAYQKPGDEIIIMDIDQVIVNNVDDMIGFPVVDNEIVSYKQWWGQKPHLIIQGGFIKFKSGTGTKIWDNFIKNPEYWQLYYYNEMIVHYKYFGEQNFIKDRARHHNINITLMEPEWVGIYGLNKKQNLKNNRTYMDRFKEDYMIMDKPNPKVKIVHFLNPLTTIHQCKNDWIKDYWK